VQHLQPLRVTAEHVRELLVEHPLGRAVVGDQVRQRVPHHPQHRLAGEVRVAHHREVEQVEVPVPAARDVEQLGPAVGLEAEARPRDVVGVVDLDPPLVRDDGGGERLLGVVADHPQHGLVVRQRVDVVRVAVRQRPQDAVRERRREPVQVQGLVGVRVVEVAVLALPRDDVGDDAVGHRDDGAVHAGAEPLDERDVGGRVLDEPGEHALLDEDVALRQQQVVVRRERLERDRQRDDVVRAGVAVVVHERERHAGVGGEEVPRDLVAGVARDDRDRVDAHAEQLVDHAAEDRVARHREEGLVHAVGHGGDPLERARRQDECLHVRPTFRIPFW
jgi:hypothetical protein